MTAGADATYNQSTGGNYKRQGGTGWVIGGEVDMIAGSQFDMESGAEFNMASGSTFNVASGAVVNMAGTLNVTGTIATSGITATGPIDLSTAGSYIVNFFENGTTTADLKPYGCSVITKSSAAGNQVFTIGAPITGVRKEIAVVMADSSDKVIVDMASNQATLKTYTGQTLNQLVFATSGATNNWAGGITMIGASTALWVVIAQSGTIATTS